MSTTSIFLSHSHKDNEWCQHLIDALNNAAFDVWFDSQDLYLGDQWIDALEREIKARDFFLIVLTPDSWASKWVRKELQLALNHDKPILGVKHKPVDLTGFLTTYQILDATTRNVSYVAEAVADSIQHKP